MQSLTKTCSKCHQAKVCVQSGTNTFGEPRYADERDRAWLWNTCPDCIRARRTAFDRSRGIRSIDECQNPKVAKGRKAERIVEKYLASLGYSNIALTKYTGPDITCSCPKSGERVTVEVKSTVREGGSWRVPKIHPSRRKDDFVAIVLPDDSVMTLAMSTYLSRCGRSDGSTCITRIIERRLPELFRQYSKRRPRSDISSNWDGEFFRTEIEGHTYALKE